VLKLLNIPIDMISMYFLMWNVGLVGMISIHLAAPLFMQQAYLLIMSSMMALTFIKFIPDWSVWTVLAILSIWDVVAVLCPRGPLRILVETAQKRKEPIFPALIYSSGVTYLSTVSSTVMGLGTTTSVDSNATRDEARRRAAETSDEAAFEDSSSRSSATVQIQTNPLDSTALTGRGSAAGPSEPLASSAQPTQSFAYFISRSSLPEVNLNAARPATSGPANSGAIGVTSTTQMIRSTDDEIETNSTCSSEDVGIKLGLGDFIFYSVLVGKASVYNDWNTTLACFVAILIGLCLTLFLLAIFNKALPALPISITFGLVFYFCTSLFVQPLADTYSSRHIFI
jgi:presenilin 1